MFSSQLYLKSIIISLRRVRVNPWLLQVLNIHDYKYSWKEKIFDFYEFSWTTFQLRKVNVLPTCICINLWVSYLWSIKKSSWTNVWLSCAKIRVIQTKTNTKRLPWILFEFSLFMSQTHLSDRKDKCKTPEELKPV